MSHLDAKLALMRLFLPPDPGTPPQAVIQADGTVAYVHTFTPSEPLPYAERAAILRDVLGFDDETIRETIGDPPEESAVR